MIFGVWPGSLVSFQGVRFGCRTLVIYMACIVTSLYCELGLSRESGQLYLLLFGLCAVYIGFVGYDWTTDITYQLITLITLISRKHHLPYFCKKLLLHYRCPTSPSLVLQTS